MPSYLYVVIKGTAFWDVRTYNLVGNLQSVRHTCCLLHLCGARD
jgi:hypothetical protein